MSKYNSEAYKEWYEDNKDRIKSSKTLAKKTYRRTEAGRAAQRRYNHKESRKIYVRNRALVKNYGITLEQYDQMVLEKDSCCDICGNQEERLHVDHCHETNKVRGLLCGSCNRALGLLKDNPELFDKAIRYLGK